MKTIHNDTQRRSASGLTAAEVEESRALHGENVLTPPRHRSLWRLYLEKYEDPIVRILLVAAAISLALAFINNDFIETIGIILAVFFATTVGFYFERDAAKKFDILTALGEEQPVKVLRDGEIRVVARRDVVVGDIVLIETGDEVPADGTLVEANGLRINESSLTGEQIARKEAQGAEEAADKGDTTHDSPAADGDTAAAYPAWMVMRSTMVMNGSGRFRVTAVGDATEIGRVAREATEITGLKTPLNEQLNRLAKRISIVGTAVAVLAFSAFLLHSILTKSLWAEGNYLLMAEEVLRYFMMAVTLIVMAVPEGLPMAVTLALALNMRRMLRSNILVRKLNASETMGAVTVICTDKTGTLTENRMAVAEMHYADGADSEALLTDIAVNSTAHITDGKGIGNPTEVALLEWLNAQGADYRQQRHDARVIARIPFSTERKFMATLYENKGRRRIAVKGAPEIVAAMCTMPAATEATMRAALRDYQSRGMRTLAFAAADVTTLPAAAIETLLHHLTLESVTAISDPVRSDVPEAIRHCRAAGIKIKVVTGDTALTAIEVARQAGILPEGEVAEGLVVSGSDFAEMDDETAAKAAQRLMVMSRARPQDKQRLVELLQKAGEVVAVTGDGTNDAPALNYAHVGISLGSGTSVAKNASDITVIDDSFHSIVKAVQWGRSLYRNIQRFIFFQLVVNVTALILVLGGSLVGTDMPLTVTQILWVNLIMDTFAAMALASLPPSRDVMNIPPRPRRQFIITGLMARYIAFWGISFAAMMLAYWCYLELTGGEGINRYELTKFFTAFVMLQWWNLFNAKALFSRHFWWHRIYAAQGFLFVLLLIIGGQWLITVWGDEIFRTVPLQAEDWGKIIGITSIVMIIGTVYKAFKK